MSLEKKEDAMVIDPTKNLEALKGLASEIRVNILNLLLERSHNVNELAQALSLPQSTIATNVMSLEKGGLIKTEMVKASKGSQKICHALFSNFLIAFPKKQPTEDLIEVEMPIGLFNSFEISPPCGLTSSEKIIGFLDTPSSFLSPERVRAGLLWFESGYVEYKFPNNLVHKQAPIQKIELSMEISSESIGTEKNWPSDVSVLINHKAIGTWTSPGDFGDKRGKFTPSWWKAENSQYGLLKTWSITEEGSFIDGAPVSDITLDDLELFEHFSIRVKIQIDKDAKNRGGLNLFGRGFGNHNQDLLLRVLY